MTSTYTPAQAAAIESEATNIVVTAGPGSGKTRTLVARIENRKTDPKAIVALSFTNAAANELRRRLPKELVSLKGDESLPPIPAPIELGFLGTLHSFALKMLKEHGAPFGYGVRTAIIAPDSAEDLMASKATSLGCKTPVERLLKLKAAEGRPKRGTRLSLDQTVVATYLDELKEAKVVDYDVLLHEFLAMLTDPDPAALSAAQSLAGVYEDLYVDECQDSSPVQWAIYRALPIPNKFYVGDPDQNLYEWNGARVIELIRESAAPGTHNVALEDNFRSNRSICEAAQRLIEHNKIRIPKVTRPVSEERGLVVNLGEFDNEGAEVAEVAAKIRSLRGVETTMYPPQKVWKEIAVIARTNAICNGFRTALPALGVPVVEQKQYALPWDWPLAKATVGILIDPENDALAYFYLVARLQRDQLSSKEARNRAQKMRVEANAKGMSINKAFLNMEPVERPETAIAALVGAGVSRQSHMIAVETLRELPPGATLDDFSLALGALTEYTKEDTETEGVHVLSIHGSKGKEFDAVFFVGLEDQTIPGRAADESPAAIEGERRAAYVAMTRARRALYLSSVKTRTSAWKQVLARKPSRFLQEIVP